MQHLLLHLRLILTIDYDDNNFFDDTTPEGTARRATLEQAGQYYENYINDNLSAIVEDTSSTVGIGYEWGSPQRKNTWTISFPHPATGIQTTIDSPTFAKDEITIYVGGRDLSSLGTGGAGGLGYPIYGDGNGNVLNQDFIDLIKGRGQTGALTNPATDFSLWGGSIAFDNNLNSGYSWHNKISTSELDSSEYDFLSIAIHEIGHTLGFGKDSWDAQVSGTNFTGTYSIDAYNKANETSVTAVPLDASA